ncbi:hypothetical protein MP228_009814 [Amoeboaphelidium protococcarum]|nr:hypothetical protein MP228_009814 [Amoeboaphelidium protococcarum]
MMQFENERFKTFFQAKQLWKHPLEWKANPTSLSKAGFYKCSSVNGSGDTDNVKCYICEQQVSGWTAEMDPMDVHRSDSADCPLVVLLSAQSIADDVKLSKDYDDVMQEARLRTFISWPYDKMKGWKPTSKKLAKAGFYYAPTDMPDDGDEDNIADMAQCPECLLALDGWEKDDDPMKEHKKRAPNCPFFLRQAALKKRPIAKKDTRKNKKDKDVNVDDNEVKATQDSDVHDKADQTLVDGNDAVDQTINGKDEYDFEPLPSKSTSVPTRRKRKAAAAVQRSTKVDEDSDSGESVRSNATTATTRRTRTKRTVKGTSQKSRKVEEVEQDGDDGDSGKIKTRTKGNKKKKGTAAQKPHAGDISSVSNMSIMSTASIISTIRQSRIDAKNNDVTNRSTILDEPSIYNVKVNARPEYLQQSGGESNPVSDNLLDELEAFQDAEEEQQQQQQALPSESNAEEPVNDGDMILDAIEDQIDQVEAAIVAEDEQPSNNDDYQVIKQEVTVVREEVDVQIEVKGSVTIGDVNDAACTSSANQDVTLNETEQVEIEVERHEVEAETVMCLQEQLDNIKTEVTQTMDTESIMNQVKSKSQKAQALLHQAENLIKAVTVSKQSSLNNEGKSLETQRVLLPNGQEISSSMSVEQVLSMLHQQILDDHKQKMDAHLQRFTQEYQNQVEYLKNTIQTVD